MRPVVFAIAIALLGGLGLVAAQGNTCPAFVESALERTDQVCNATGRNEACYGHVRLDAEPQANVNDFQFARIGDIAPVNAIRSLRLSAFDPDNSLWGIALMRLQANVPDTIPGQNVTFLLFGDVSVTNRVSESSTLLDVFATADTPIVSYPSANAPVLDMLRQASVIVADGRLPDSSWLRVQTLLGVQSVGWIRSEGIRAAGSIDDLDLLNPGDVRPRYRPMQAFYLTTGNEPAGCNELPSSGVLIQSPKAAGKITLSINDVEVRIGSTVLFQAQRSSKLIVTALEGSAIVKAQGVVREAVAGTRVTVPIDQNLQPAAPPSEPEPYHEAEVAAMALPARHMDTPIVVPPPRVPQMPVVPAAPTEGFLLPTATETPTETPLPTATETPLDTPTELPSPTLVPTNTLPSDPLSPTAESTASVTPSPTAESTASDPLAPGPETTPSDSSAPSPEATASDLASPEATASGALTPTPRQTGSPAPGTLTPQPTPTAY